jgi:hypothetical protein
MNESMTALANRAKTGLLFSASIDSRELFSYWLGCLRTIAELEDDGQALFLAQKDASLGGYKPPASLQAAWTALTIGAEPTTLPYVQELLRSHGVEVARDAVTSSQIDAIQKLKNTEPPVIQLNDEHGCLAVEVHDGAAEHKSPLSCGD